MTLAKVQSDLKTPVIKEKTTMNNHEDLMTNLTNIVKQFKESYPEEANVDTKLVLVMRLIEAYLDLEFEYNQPSYDHIPKYLHHYETAAFSVYEESRGQAYSFLNALMED